MKLPTTYIVLTNDVKPPFTTQSMNLAYMVFRENVARKIPVRVFVMEFDVETNAFETASEITARFADTMQPKEAA